MRYIQHPGAGGAPETMTIADGPAPELRAGEVLIEVAFAGVNRPDVIQREGKYPPPPGASPVLGLEVAGRVAAAAPDVRWPAVGDVVCALTPGGGYAELCAVPAAHCLPVPSGLSVAEAAALPENYFTVWANVFERGALKAGEKLLVHGGTGGIGITAIQLGKAFGAEVWTTVGSEEKAEAARRAGADVAINHREQDFAAVVRERTAKRGVDVILDIVGGDYVERNLRSLAVGGRLVNIAFLKGSKVTVDLLPVMTKRLTVTGSTLRPRTIAEKAALAQALREHVWPRLALGECRPWIHATFPLERAAEAHRLMEASGHIGKILLQVRS